MRKVALTLALAVAGAGVAWANGEVVHLDARTLAQVRTSNPSHYARAQKILAAANHLCRPAAGEVEYTKLGAKDVSCLHDLLRTSNPPQREIRFTLDETHYAALVVLTD